MLPNRVSCTETKFIPNFNLKSSARLASPIADLSMRWTGALSGLPEQLGTAAAGLLFVDVLHQHALVLEDITLAFHVESVVPTIINRIT